MDALEKVIRGGGAADNSEVNVQQCLSNPNSTHEGSHVVSIFGHHLVSPAIHLTLRLGLGLGLVNYYYVFLSINSVVLSSSFSTLPWLLVPTILLLLPSYCLASGKFSAKSSKLAPGSTACQETRKVGIIIEHAEDSKEVWGLKGEILTACFQP